MNRTNSIRIFIVDDHPIVIKGLKLLIESEDNFIVCGSAKNVQEARVKILELNPDVVILDISLGNYSGLELAKEIKSQSPDMPILIFSMYNESTYAERALQSGAMGYIEKKNVDERIIEAIKKILSGKIYLSEEMSSFLLQKRFIGGGEQNHLALLSDRELEVFHLLGEGLTTKQIAERLYLSHSTIGTYKANIKQKLNIRNQSELIHRAISENTTNN